MQGYITGITGNYYHAFKLKPWWKGRIQPYVGPALGGFYRSRYVLLGNSSVNEDLVFHAGITGHLRSNFKLFKKPAFATYTLNLPLLSYVKSDPLYGLSYYGTFSRIAPTGGFTQFNSELTLARQIGRNGNLLQIGYSWDYYAFNKETNPLRFARHGLSLSLMIYL